MSIIWKAGSPKSKRNRRKRATPFWRNRYVRGSFITFVCILIGVGGWKIHRNNMMMQILETVKWHTIAASTHAGFKIDDVLVIGRRNTNPKLLLSTLGTIRDFPILAFDVTLAKSRVEALPWVRRASVERKLPDVILLTVEERNPLALWQHGGQFALIDHEGSIILKEGLDNYRDLLVVIGADAPRHAAHLVELLETQPKLMSRVKAAVWVGERRWDITMIGNVNVQLPEEDPIAAWTRLAEYQRSHGVLDRDVKLVDLRLPDRLIIRKSTKGEVLPLVLGQET